jgi:hypothetical protein
MVSPSTQAPPTSEGLVRPLPVMEPPSQHIPHLDRELLPSLTCVSPVVRKPGLSTAKLC